VSVAARAAPAAALGLALALAPASAAADVTKDQCVDADTQAQILRRAGKLTAARAQLATCGDPSCPAIVRDDCSRRTDELERAQPTIIFDAKDAAGRDLSAVQVSVDGAPLAPSLDGTALKVDPGQHAFTFTAAGLAPVTSSLVVKEGEKERRERVVFAAAPAAQPAALPETPPSPSGAGLGTGKILGLALGGAGVAGIAVGSVFGLMTASAASQQKTDCASATSCNDYAKASSDHSTAQSDGTIATVACIAGGALLAGGAVLFLVARRPDEAPPTTGLLVAPSVAQGGGGLSVRGVFW